jgi:S-DNA-T family DNA segregation ATPase FtsK/SpoIIIE
MAGQDFYATAVDLVVKNNNPSISYIQRMLNISYNTAADYMEKMEATGIVSAPNQEGKRTVLKK